MNYNIFDGNQPFKNMVSRTLGYEVDESNFSQTEDMYFQTFFYLSKRFGAPKIMDDIKDGGTWDFKVKNYTIRISLNSSWVSFNIFGDIRLSYRYNQSSYFVKYHRQRNNKRHLLINNINNVLDRSDYESNQIQILLNKIQAKHNIPDDISSDEFNDKYGDEFWIDMIGDFNDKILDIGDVPTGMYSNSGTRHAMKTMEQFIKNMLTPISVRDRSFNITGRLTDSEVRNYDRYHNNIKIGFKNDRV